MSAAQSFFSPEQKKSILDAIVHAEKNTSGEIRVHIENFCLGDPLRRGTKVFHSLGISKTELKNGVLFYLAVKSKKFAIVGDTGIDKVVPANFWDAIKEQMKNDFAKGNFAEGLCTGIKAAGDQLKAHFPMKDGDKNELSNEISFRK